MWPRVVELMLGVWLAVSPFVFQGSGVSGFALANALICGAGVVSASCLSYWPPTRHARGATALVALWLIILAYWTSPHPAPPWTQNEALTGLLLLMLAIVPNEAELPPRSWRRYVRSRQMGPR